MEEWENSLKLFLDSWRLNNDVIGALVCGSYVTGHPSNRSDIDVHIILSDDIDWRERGNRYINGFLIEYFVNPPKQIRKYFEEDFADYRTMSMVQFMTGRVIFDRIGVIEELKKEAANWKRKKHSELSKIMVEMKKYELWDAHDNLLDSYENHRDDFTFLYYQSLHSMFNHYCSLLNIEPIPSNHIYQYLCNPNYLRKYLKEKFPNEEFRDLYLMAIKETERKKMMDVYGQLLNMIFNNFGGFNIDGWKITSPVE